VEMWYGSVGGARISSWKVGIEMRDRWVHGGWAKCRVMAVEFKG
jgi:hypothetical protein